jgi:hypothetical protein
VIPVYYDQGRLGVVWDYSQNPQVQVTFDNSVGRKLVENGFHAWTSVPSTSLRASVLGDFTTVGLPDITADTVSQVIGTFNGGGIYVIFDSDGTIMQNFFGAGDGVLGISTPEFGDDATSTIMESWIELNGQAIDPGDVGAAQYQGVATHEFGHAVNLAHTQTNGAAIFFGDPVGPARSIPVCRENQGSFPRCGAAIWHVFRKHPLRPTGLRTRQANRHRRPNA